MYRVFALQALHLNSWTNALCLRFESILLLLYFVSCESLFQHFSISIHFFYHLLLNSIIFHGFFHYKILNIRLLLPFESQFEAISSHIQHPCHFIAFISLHVLFKWEMMKQWNEIKKKNRTQKPIIIDINEKWSKMHSD